MWSRTEPSSTIRAIHSSWPRAKNGAPTVRRPSAYALKGAGPSNAFRLPSRCRTTNRKRITPVTAMSTFFPINERAKRGVTGDGAGATAGCIIGGQIGAYTEMCEQTRQAAYDLMIEHARELGANAVVGMCFDASEVASKASATEVLCYGTAVVLE